MLVSRPRRRGSWLLERGDAAVPQLGEARGKCPGIKVTWAVRATSRAIMQAVYRMSIILHPERHIVANMAKHSCVSPQLFTHAPTGAVAGGYAHKMLSGQRRQQPTDAVVCRGEHKARSVVVERGQSGDGTHMADAKKRAVVLKTREAALEEKPALKKQPHTAEAARPHATQGACLSQHPSRRAPNCQCSSTDATCS